MTRIDDAGKQRSVGHQTNKWSLELERSFRHQISGAWNVNEGLLYLEKKVALVCDVILVGFLKTGHAETIEGGEAPGVEKTSKIAFLWICHFWQLAVPEGAAFPSFEANGSPVLHHLFF